ncbi:MAG: Plasmid pRiA4b ORF-3-like protein [Bacteroidetes bacterium]|nr:Plasmid pRiA4b ORF-3-like protein [Bacteroidota bacterium]
MGTIFQFKVTLRNVKPVIWRRFLVKDDITFWDLHYTIQIVMGWENCHLHQFAKGRDRYIGDLVQMEGEVEDEDEILVKTIFDKPGTTIRYDYDFGDGWEHDIVLEKILEVDPGLYYPRCIKGKSNCPPEDSGGPYGFMNMMEILASGKGRQKKEILEWLGDDYDPAKFNLQEVNEILENGIEIDFDK